MTRRVESTEEPSVAQLAKLQEREHNQSRSRRPKAVRDNRLRGCRVTWPMVCEAMGVGPEELPKVRAEDARRGLKVDYTPDGDPIFVSARQRREYCESYGYYDRNGGYSDPQRTGQLAAELEAAGAHEWGGGFYELPL